MPLPPYYLKRPEPGPGPADTAEFDELFARQIATGGSETVEYTCSAPKWQFLAYLGDSKDVLLHGTGDPEISEFEPRQSESSEDFGDQKAVYASSDGLWAAFFAVMDRDRYRLSLVNSCFRMIEPDGRSVPYYYFSINADALAKKPWRSGTIYVLPRDGFEQASPGKSKHTGLETETAHWRSFSGVKPLAKIAVEPTDFPFLDQIRGHDFDLLVKRVEANPDNFPWLED